MSFIYVIANKVNPEHSKIGVSKKPSRRLKQLQTGHPVELEIYGVEEIEDDKVRGMERIVHKLLAEKRMTGEWFALPPHDALLEVRHAVIRYGDEPDITVRLNGGTFNF